jgi:PAS domain S-box-containing protein
MRNWRVPVTFTMSLEGRFTSWSEGVRVALGYEPAAFIAQGFSVLFTSEDVEGGLPVRLLEKAAEEGSASLAGWRVDQAGRRVFTRGEVTALYGPDLEMVGYSVVLLPSPVGPTSPRSRAQPKRVGDSEMPDPGVLAGLLSNVDERFYVLDERFDFTYVNDQAARDWGRRREELVGSNLITSFPEVLDTDFLAQHLKAANDGVIVRVESESPMTRSKVELSIYPNRAGGVSVLVREPLERHERRDAVFSEERLAEAYAALEIAVIDWVPSSGSWNESGTTVEVFGLEPGTVVGGPGRHLELIHPGDRDRYGRAVAAALRDGDGWRLEYRIVRPADGEVAWLEEDGKVTRDKARSVRCTVMAWDITARKVAEEESRGSQRRLERELASNRRLREIIARIADADEPREALDQLVVAISDLFAADRGAIRALGSGAVVSVAPGASRLLRCGGPIGGDHRRRPGLVRQGASVCVATDRRPAGQHGPAPGGYVAERAVP